MVAGPNPAEGSILTNMEPHIKNQFSVSEAYHGSINIVICETVTRQDDDDIYHFSTRIKNHRKALATLENGQMALDLLDHFAVLGLSPARISKYATELRTLLKHANFNPKSVTKKEVEKVVA
jgi:hypothetical protein